MTLDEILGNKELGDDFEITLGDKGAFRLGDLRSLHGDRESLRTERESLAGERDRYRTDLEKQSQQLTALMAEAGRRAQQETEAPPPPNPQEQFMDSLRKLVAPNDPSAPLFEDKMFGSAFNRVKSDISSEIDGKLKGITDQYNSLKEMFDKYAQTTANAQLYEREQRWWADNRHDAPSIDGKKITLDTIKRFATENNIAIPGTQIIDYDRALDMISAPIRAKQELNEAQEKAYQQGLIAGRTGKGQVLPFMSDRSGGGNAAPAVNTKGRNPREFMKEAVTNGLRDVMAGNE